MQTVSMRWEQLRLHRIREVLLRVKPFSGSVQTVAIKITEISASTVEPSVLCKYYHFNLVNS